MTTIEYCTNDEWLASAICDEAGDDNHTWRSEAATEYVDTAIRVAEDEGLTVERASGQRILFHGWNGAHFTWRAGIFGVFGELTDEEKRILESADAAGRKAAELFLHKRATNA